MKTRSLSFLVALVLTAGCGGSTPRPNRDVQAFLGVWSLTERRTVTYADITRTETFTSTVEITEGVNSDILISDSRGCAFPAMVDKKVATFSETTCLETEDFSGESARATFHLEAGTAMITGESIHLDYQASLSATVNGLLYEADLQSQGDLRNDNR